MADKNPWSHPLLCNMNLWRRIEHFWLRRERDTTLGVAHRVWGIVALYVVLIQGKDIVRIFSGEGYFSFAELQSLLPHTIRTPLFTLFSETAEGVLFLYALLVISLLLATLRIATLWTTLLSLILLTSFDERAIFTGEGGDTVIRLVGYILLLALIFDPAVRNFLSRKKRESDNEPKDFPVWPRHLFFAQLIVLYLSSAWTKLLGHSWLDGSAVYFTLHHPDFQRFPDTVMGIFDPLSPLFSIATLIFELLWITPLLQWCLRITRFPVRPLLLCSGIIFHAAIFLLLDVGTFSLALLPAYIGAWIPVVHSPLWCPFSHAPSDTSSSVATLRSRRMRFFSRCPRCNSPESPGPSYATSTG